MVYIYVLGLASGKYYIGKTENPKFRISDHVAGTGRGAAWTKKFKPISLIELLSNCDDFDEDKITLKYMNKYGVNNVRGGSFVQVVLPREEIIVLEKMLRSSDDLCFICGSADHWARDCKFDRGRDIPKLTISEDMKNAEGIMDSETLYYTGSSHGRDEESIPPMCCPWFVICARCGRFGHLSTNCPNE